MSAFTASAQEQGREPALTRFPPEAQISQSFGPKEILKNCPTLGSISAHPETSFNRMKCLAVNVSINNLLINE
jgi:hypothetical protein